MTNRAEEKLNDLTNLAIDDWITYHIEDYQNGGSPKRYDELLKLLDKCNGMNNLTLVEAILAIEEIEE